MGKGGPRSGGWGSIDLDAVLGNWKSQTKQPTTISALR